MQNSLSHFDLKPSVIYRGQRSNDRSWVLSDGRAPIFFKDENGIDCSVRKKRVQERIELVTTKLDGKKIT